jgi:predicted metal-dependent phosphotriesterase family hydrolase
MMIAEARKRGINAILVTHAMVSTIRMTVAQMKEAADAGALIEFAYNGLIGAQPEATVEQYVAAARAIGPDRCVLSSDLGQANNPLPVDGMRAYIDLLVKRGFGAREIRRMTVENPASLLGLR